MFIFSLEIKVRKIPFFLRKLICGLSVSLRIMQIFLSSSSHLKEVLIYQLRQLIRNSETLIFVRDKTLQKRKQIFLGGTVQHINFVHIW